MGKIKVTECGGIKGLKVVEPTVFGDARGYFMETSISRSITHRINWYVL